MDSNDYKSLVLYNGRLRFYNTMQKISLEGLAKFPTQSEYRLFNGIALALGNRMQECIRELSPLKNDSELGLAAITTLIYAHKHCSLQDLDALHALESRIETEGKNTTSASSCYYIAVFLFLIGEFGKTLDYIDRSLKINPDFDAALLLKIWCELSTCVERPANAKLQNLLEGCIARSNGKNIDATLALVRFYQQRRQFKPALLLINKLSIRFPDINITLVEKMETQMAALEWENSLDTAMRTISMESFNIAALRLKGFLHIVRESNIKAGVATLQQLLSSLELIEASNHTLLIEICQLFSRICSKNVDLLEITLRCVEKVNKQNFENVNLLTELGYQKLLLNNVADAEIAFRSACNIDSSNFNALCGLTLCKLKTFGQFGKTQQIKQQLAYLTHLTENKQDPMVLYMTALVADPKEEPYSPVELLVKAADAHLKKCSIYPFGVEYVCTMNPDFMLTLCEDLIRHSPTPKREFYNYLDLGQQPLHITFKQSLNILEVVLNICPGHQGALLLRAKVDFLCGEYSKAINRLHHILKLFGNSFGEALILLAQILTETKQYSKALEYLELSLAQTFQVRERPMYHLLKGVILKNQRKFSEAHQCFISAFELLGGMRSPHPNNFVLQAYNTFTSSDKMTLYIELINALRDMRDVHGIFEIERILQNAVEEFNGTPEIGRLIIAQSQLALQKCNITEAISLLLTIKKDQSYFIQARTQLANIYLQHQKNRCAFSKCFNELVIAKPESNSYLMLGEAYLSIQETDLAIDAYKKACDICPSNIILIRKLGRAYVRSHHYDKAVKYYDEITKDPKFNSIKLDLAELFLQLKQFHNAVKLLANPYKDNTKDGNLTDLHLRTKQLLLLARVYEKSGNSFETLRTLQEARDNQYRVRELCSIEQTDSLREQSKLLSRICIQIAQKAVKMKNSELAMDHFKQCIIYAPNDTEILVSLAQLQMQSEKMDMCRHTCSQIFQLDGSNETALVLMADLSFRKMEYKNAAYHFSQLILSQPCNWTALARLIEVMRRSGTLSESVPFIQRAEQTSSKCKSLAGLNYCRGLFAWYSGNLNSALRYFNEARRDHVWGQQAKLNMIEICIHPDDGVMIANDLFETGVSEELSESRTIALRTADRLLKEMRPCSGEIFEYALTRRVLWNLLQIASKQKVQVESALKDLTEIVQNDCSPLTITAVYALALALVQLKQIHRAKNQLKQIAQLTWNYEEAEYLEKSWLLIADIYIHANKLDVAESFVERVLEYNKSSTKAYELSGYIAEKLQYYDDAAEQYKKAWISSGCSKPSIGYKLALSNMKGKKYVSAVNVCQQVLKLHPDFTTIRKDILEKCRNNLRI